MKTSIKIIPVLFLFSLCACKGGTTTSQNNNNKKTQDTIKTFTLPEIPVMLTTPEQRSDFLVRHYWDNINFADTNYAHHPEVTEQAWVDYSNILSHVPLNVAQESMRNTIERAAASKTMFTCITGLAEKYLYDPNSPMRNEEFFIPVLEGMIKSPILKEAEKIRPTALLELAHKNRIGTKALNFKYTLESGAQNTLYNLRADYILLFINNPGCHACEETIGWLKEATNINRLLSNKKLIILSLYPDEELDEWKKHLSEFANTWIKAYDKGQIIKNEQIYDLKAIPTLYLLDKDKKVLLKDVPVPTIEEYLKIH